jgi:hypothetical protein
MKTHFVLMTAVLLTGTLGCSSGDRMPANSITGTVTLKGAPVRFASLAAISRDGEQRVSRTDEDGHFLIVNPPAGELIIRFVDLPPPSPPRPNPPPRAGVKYDIPPPREAMTPPPPPTTIPARYVKPDAGLPFHYEGGRQTFDIDLKP